MITLDIHPQDEEQYPQPTLVICRSYALFDIWCFENLYDIHDKSQVKMSTSIYDILELPDGWRVIILDTNLVCRELNANNTG